MSRQVDPSLAARTRDVYRRHAEDWDRRRPRALFERGWLDRFRAHLAPGAPVLDLGCGGGEPIARYLIEAGHPVTGVDAAGPMIALARRRFPAERWIEADMRGLALGARFGGIVAWDSFFHLTKPEQRGMFPIFARHLAPCGALLFTSGPGESEAAGTVEQTAVYHASLSPAAYAALLEANRIEVRAYMAEDPDCDRHTVWLARSLSEGTAPYAGG